MRIRRRTKILIGAGAVLAASVVALPVVAPSVVLSAAMRLERGAAGLDHRVVQVDDHRVHYLEGGPADAPVVLLVHGFGGDKDNWTRMARHLSDGYRVVAPDLPGWGESSRLPAASYDIKAQAARLEAFRKTIGLKRFHLAGNSMGGHLAGVYAATYPDPVRSVGLFNNGGVPEVNASELSKALARGEHPLLVEDAEGFRRMMAFIFVEVPFIPGPVEAYFAERAVRNRAFTKRIWQDLINRPAPLMPLLSKLSMPVLILWGDTDRLLDVSIIQNMTPALPHASVVVMKACGHTPMIERPEETSEHYLAFLSKGQVPRPSEALALPTPPPVPVADAPAR